MMLLRTSLCLTALALAAALLPHPGPLVSTVLAAETAAEPGNLNPLAPQAWSLNLGVWTAVVFLLLLAILAKFAWKPITEGLDKREQHVADQLTQAEAANKQAKDTLADYERRLAAAGDQVRSILEQGRRHAEELSRELLEKAKHDAEAEHQRALRQIEAAADAATKDLADQSAALAVRLAGQILQAEIKPRDHARLINQAVAGFTEKRD